MNDSKKLTKIILTAVGILIVFRLVGILLPGTIYFCFNSDHGNVFVNIGLFLISVAIIIAVIKLFFPNNDWLVGKIIKSESAESIGSPMPTEAAFRLAAFLVGSYVLLMNLSFMFMSLRIYLQYRGMQADGRQFSGPAHYSLWPHLLLVIFAVYFIFGAPHLVRWHVKRSEQLAADIAKAQDSFDELT